MIKAEISFVNSEALIGNVFMIVDILQWSEWIIIFLEKVKRGTYLQRKGFAEKWHKKTLVLMPNKQLILLIGAYSQRYYLKQRSTEN